VNATLLDRADLDAALRPVMVRRLEVFDHEVEGRVSGLWFAGYEHEMRTAAQLEDRDVRVLLDLAHTDIVPPPRGTGDVTHRQQRVTDPDRRAFLHARQCDTR